MNEAEIVERWKGKWVLIEYRELDRNLDVVGEKQAIDLFFGRSFRNHVTVQGTRQEHGDPLLRRVAH